jgi:septation ring formation regulator EzrA
MAVIEEIYNKVVILNFAIRDYMSPFQQSKSGKFEDFDAEQKDKQQKAFEYYNDLNRFYLTKKLFFDESTSSKMEELLKIIHSKIWDFTSPERKASYGVQPKDLLDEYKKKDEASDYIIDEIPKILTALEKELQKMIGAEA